MKCEYCGKEIEKSSYDSSINKILCGKNECWDKYYWENKIKEKNDNTVIIDGCMFYIDDEDEKDKFRGFGGISFKIKMFGEEKVLETKNLWYNGKIPMEYRNELKDNAVFIK